MTIKIENLSDQVARLLFENVKLREIKVFIDYKIKVLTIFTIYQNDVINVFYIKFKLIKKLNILDLNILKQKMNNILNKFDKMFVVLIKNFFNVKNLISLHESVKILNVFLILRK